MNNSIKLLFGFDVPNVISAVVKYVRSCGYEVSYDIKVNKSSIKAYLEDHADCSTVILKEVVSANSSYEADELAELADLRDLNIVLILGERHKGTKYMQTLYAAGITSAIFQKGRGGVSYKEIAELILNKRNRRDARTYYGIGSDNVDIGLLSAVEVRENIDKLNDEEYGVSIADRLIYVAKKMSPQQTADFIRRLPENYIEELQCFEEFYQLVEFLNKQYKMKLPYKRPRNLKKGISIAKEESVVEEVVEDKPVEVIPEPEEELDSLYGLYKNEEESIKEEEKMSTGGFNFDNFDFGDDLEENVGESVSMSSTEPLTVQEEVTPEAEDISPKSSNGKKVKEKKVKSVGPKKSGFIVLVAVGALALCALVACGVANVVEEIKETTSANEVTVNETSGVEEESIFSGAESTSDNDLGNGDIVVDDTEEDAESEEGTDSSAAVSDNATVVAGVDSTTGLPIGGSGQTDYTYVPDTQSSDWSSEGLYDGLVVGGIEVVNIINANPGIRFTVSNPYTAEVIIYVSGGASASDIPADRNYRLTAVDGTYIFTLVE